MLELNKIYNEDCLGDKEKNTGMWRIPDKFIDCIITDLPYGTTRNKWDSVIPLNKLWEHYERIIKDNGVIVLFSSQPFTSALVMSNPKLFKYEIIWDKVNISNPMLAKKQVLKSHENILVFYKKQPTYNPQMSEGKMWKRGGNEAKNSEAKFMGIKIKRECVDDKTNLKYPKSIITFSNANRTNVLHPTQKPVELCEWLIKTFTNKEEIVLDNCMGSGTTAIACINTNRKYIGFEIEKEYYDLAIDRINKHLHIRNK